MNMLNNPYVLNGIISLVSTIVLYLLCRTDDKPCSWKVYLKHLVIVFITGVQLIRKPKCTVRSLGKCTIMNATTNTVDCHISIKLTH